MNELVSITATIFRPGEDVAAEALRALDTGLWAFGKPGIQSIWDCVVDRATTPCRFHVEAIHFAVQPLPNPACPYPEGSLLAVQLDWEWSPAEAFSHDVPVFNQIVRRHLLRWRNPSTVQFIGVYAVDSVVQRDEFDGKDAWVEAYFQGELDMNAELPLTTSALENAVLHSLLGHIAMRITTLADLVKRDVAAPAFRLALDHLSDDGLIASQFGFFYCLTETGTQVAQQIPLLSAQSEPSVESSAASPNSSKDSLAYVALAEPEAQVDEVQR